MLTAWVCMPWLCRCGPCYVAASLSGKGCRPGGFMFTGSGWHQHPKAGWAALQLGWQGLQLVAGGLCRLCGVPLQVKNKDFVVAEHQELMQNSGQAFVRTLFPAEAQDTNGGDKVSLLSSPGAWGLILCLSAAAGLI